MKKVVVIGGGTGTFVVLSALKALSNVDLTAIVTVADSGGSTKRLRDEFGFLAVGDLRQALAAFTEEQGRGGDDNQNWIKNLLLYRFSKGNGLEGHNLGNLILTALQDMTGSTAKAIEVASKIFRLQGHIFPITTKNIQLVVEYNDGTVEIGEHNLDDDKHGGDKVVSVKTSPRAKIYVKAGQAVESANAIIIGPGDLYGSIMPNLVVDGAAMAIKRSKAKLVSIMNLMTRYTQTHNLSVKDHLEVIERQIGKRFDTVVVNNAKISDEILAAYKNQHEYPVKDDLDNSRQIIRTPLIKTALVKQLHSDAVRRSYLRHDPIKLSKIMKKIIYES
ncbi:YvcK family protein [Candidatus Collierbacteria bacterium]|nr:YvcK family protein [Candidatus Collierbacteria bacterium]